MSNAAATDCFDPLSTEFAADPYAVYEMLRSQARPCFHRGLNAHLLARFEDVDTAARSPSMVRTREAFLPPDVLDGERAAARSSMPNHFLYVQFSLLDSDGAVHRRLLGLLPQPARRGGGRRGSR